MTFSGRTETQCPHGQRGTSVCLYCRQDARDVARKRRNKLLTRFGLTTLGGGVVIALVVGVLVTLAPASRTSTPAEADTATSSAAPPVVTSSAGASADSARPSLLSPQIAPGRRELGDGVFADRVGDEVTVTFDTDSLRTRIDWKFEGIVRATLPMVFGDAARGALDRIESGSLLERRNLIRDLPRRGVQIPLDSGLGTIRIYPILRQGRDGPIVTAYRADVIK